MGETVAALESSNRYLAKCRDRHPDKFVAMATCVPGGGDECLKELERAKGIEPSTYSLGSSG